MELKIDKEWIKEAVQPVIDDIKENFIPKSVIEDIKAEADGLLNDSDSALYQHGVLDVLEIIDKHIAERNRNDIGKSKRNTVS